MAFLQFLSVLAALFCSAASIACVRRAVKDKQEGNIDGMHGFIGLGAAAFAATVLFGLWPFAGFLMAVSFAGAAILIAMCVLKSINWDRSENDPLWIGRENKWWYHRIIAALAAVLLLLLHAPKVHFGPVALALIVVAALCGGAFSVHRAGKDRAETKKTDKKGTLRRYYRTFGVVAIFAGLVMAILWGLIFVDGQLPLAWWLTLVAAMALVVFVLVSDAKGGGIDQPDKKWWKRWNHGTRRVLAVFLLFGLFGMLYWTGVAVDNARGEGTNPESQSVLDKVKECDGGNVLTTYTFSREDFKGGDTITYLTGDVDALLFVMGKLNQDERNNVEAGLAPLQSEDPSIIASLEDIENAENPRALLEDEGCMSALGQVIALVIDQKIDGPDLREYFLLYLDSKQEEAANN